MKRINTEHIKYMKDTMVKQITSVLLGAEDIEFNNPFIVFIPESTPHTLDTIMVEFIVKGITNNGQTLIGEVMESEYELNIDQVEWIEELAYILDEISLGHYKLICNE